MSRFEDREFTEDTDSAIRCGDIANAKLKAIEDPNEREATTRAYVQMISAIMEAGYPAPSLGLAKALRIMADSLEQMAEEWAEREAQADDGDDSAWSKRRAS